MSCMLLEGEDDGGEAEDLQYLIPSMSVKSLKRLEKLPSTGGEQEWLIKVYLPTVFKRIQ